MVIFDEFAVDSVGDAAFQRSEGFLVGFALGDFAVVVDPSGVWKRIWVTAAAWMAWFSTRFPRSDSGCLVLPPDENSMGAVPL